MFYVYVLYSLKDNRLYKGFTSDISKRLLRHNSGGNKSTASRTPFVLVHLESFLEKKEALKREKYIKSLEGGSKMKKYLQQLGILGDDMLLNR